MYHLDTQFYFSCAAKSNGMRLLPHVREIDWTSRNEIYPCFTLLLSRMTYCLRLNFQPKLGTTEEIVESQREELSLIRTIPALSPHITDLTLSGVTGPWPNVRDTLQYLNVRLPLQRLELIDFPEMSAFVICNISNLRNLCLMKCRSEPPFPSPLPSNCHGFLRLEELQIWVSRIEFITALTNIMHNAPLRYLSIQSSHRSRGNFWKQVFDGIHNGIAHPSLAVVQITPTLGRSFVDEDPVTLEDMLGLLVFTNLTQLNLQAMNGFDLDDEQMKTLVLALPRLKHLSLLSYLPQPNRPRMTFEGLHSVAQCCPKLESLGVMFDARNVVEHSGICNVNTESINVSHSLVDDPALVSAALLATFPSLLQVVWSDYRDSSTEELKALAFKWKEVNNLINLKHSNPSNS
jgi:hypothetical protein